MGMVSRQEMKPGGAHRWNLHRRLPKPFYESSTAPSGQGKVFHCRRVRLERPFRAGRKAFTCGAATAGSGYIPPTAAGATYGRIWWDGHTGYRPINKGRRTYPNVVFAFLTYQPLFFVFAGGASGDISQPAATSAKRKRGASTGEQQYNQLKNSTN